jgi:hypothetical protein
MPGVGAVVAAASTLGCMVMRLLRVVGRPAWQDDDLSDFGGGGK